MTDAGAGAAVHVEAPARVRGLVLVDGGQALCRMLAGMRLPRWSCADGRPAVLGRGEPPRERRLQKRCQNSEAYEGTASRQNRIFLPSAKPRAT